MTAALSTDSNCVWKKTEAYQPIRTGVIVKATQLVAACAVLPVDTILYCPDIQILHAALIKQSLVQTIVEQAENFHKQPKTSVVNFTYFGVCDSNTSQRRYLGSCYLNVG